MVLREVHGESSVFEPATSQDGEESWMWTAPLSVPRSNRRTNRHCNFDPAGFVLVSIQCWSGTPWKPWTAEAPAWKMDPVWFIISDAMCCSNLTACQAFHHARKECEETENKLLLNLASILHFLIVSRLSISRLAAHLVCDNSAGRTDRVWRRSFSGHGCVAALRRWAQERSGCTVTVFIAMDLSMDFRGKSLTRWWFQRFLLLTPIWGRLPFWLIFFKGVETTN